MANIVRAEPRAYPFAPDPGGLQLHQLYGELRAHEPVCRVELPYGGRAWLVTRYEDVRRVFTDHRFSRAAASGRAMPRVGPVSPPDIPGNITAMDPPEHTRVRRLVASAFTRRRVESLRPRVEQIATGLLDEMVAQGPPADLVSGFSFPLPITVICELLGIAQADRGQFSRWADVMVAASAITEDQFLDAAAGLLGYFAELFAERRNRPGGDLLTALAQARDGGAKLSEEELLCLGMALLVGGYETTATEITLMTYSMLTHPSHLRQLLEQPGLLPAAVEEMLRWIPLASNALLPRVATEDVELSGTVIRAGDVVLASRSAANRDETVFAAADTLDFQRDPSPHLGFGHGWHFCLGAHLARVELQVGLGSLLSRLPGLGLAVAPGELAWRTGLTMRGLAELPVTW
jgi:cytochrome P450